MMCDFLRIAVLQRQSRHIVFNVNASLCVVNVITGYGRLKN